MSKVKGHRCYQASGERDCGGQAANDISPEQAQGFLGWLYDNAIDGVPLVGRPADELARDYVCRYPSELEAARALASNQIAKCATSGFVTGLGGAVTLPVAVPANICSVAYVQLRMVVAIAVIGGYDPRSDQVQTLAYACLAGKAVSDVLKDAGVKVGERLAVSAIKRVPRKALAAINRKISFRLLTKFGEKGLINMGKMVPLVGGVIGGAFDAATTKAIADNAIGAFIEGKAF